MYICIYSFKISFIRKAQLLKLTFYDIDLLFSKLIDFYLLWFIEKVIFKFHEFLQICLRILSAFLSNLENLRFGRINRECEK